MSWHDETLVQVDAVLCESRYNRIMGSEASSCGFHTPPAHGVNSTFEDQDRGEEARLRL